MNDKDRIASGNGSLASGGIEVLDSFHLHQLSKGLFIFDLFISSEFWGPILKLILLGQLNLNVKNGI